MRARAKELKLTQVHEQIEKQAANVFVAHTSIDNSAKAKIDDDDDAKAESTTPGSQVPEAPPTRVNTRSKARRSEDALVVDAPSSKKTKSSSLPDPSVVQEKGAADVAKEGSPPKLKSALKSNKKKVKHRLTPF